MKRFWFWFRQHISGFVWFIMGTVALLVAAWMNDVGIYHSVASVLMITGLVCWGVAMVRGIMEFLFPGQFGSGRH